MNRLARGNPCFAKARRALLACVLGLCLAALWPGAASASGSEEKLMINGPNALIDSATDDGGGRIRVSWSLSTPAPNESFVSSHPHKVCVFWEAVENGVNKPPARKCFTSEASTQADLVFDSGIGDDVPSAVYRVYILAYYDNIPMYPPDDVKVTVKGQG